MNSAWQRHWAAPALLVFCLSSCCAAVGQSLAPENCAPQLQSARDYVWNYITQRDYSGFHLPVLNGLLKKAPRLGIAQDAPDLERFLLKRSVLSLGEGNSDFIEMLLTMKMDATAVDAQSTGRFAQNRALNPHRFLVQNMQELKFNRQFDLIYSSYSLNFLTFHISKLPPDVAEKDLEALLTRLMLPLTEGGLLIAVPGLLAYGSRPLWDKVLESMRQKGFVLELWSEIPVDADPKMYNPSYGSNREHATIIKLVAKPGATHH